MTYARNVIDYYKYFTTDAIKADLDEKRHPFSVLVSNQIHDFNLGSVIRNANAFLASEVIIYGRKQYDRRSTVGTHLYTNFKHVREEEDLEMCLSSTQYPMIGIDNLEGAVPMDDFVWPEEHFIMAFGQEQVGLPQEIVNRCSKIVYIKQFGSVRSLNVGCASGIAMYDFCRKLVYKQKGIKNYVTLNFPYMQYSSC